MRHAVPLLAVLLVAGCVTDDPPNECGTGGPGRAAPVTRVIGPEGGTLAITAGPLACTTLEVERGVLSERITFRLSETFDLDLTVGEFTAEAAGPAVKLEADREFSWYWDHSPVRLTLPFRPAPEDPENLLLFTGGYPYRLADGFDVDAGRGRASVFTTAAGHFQIGRLQASCPAPLQPCDDACLDLRSDRYRCGTCGHRCSSGESCVAGVCEEPGGTTIAQGDIECPPALGARHVFFRKAGRLTAVTRDGGETLDLGNWPLGDCPTFLELSRVGGVYVASDTGDEGWVELYPLDAPGRAYRVTPPGHHGRVNGMAFAGDRLYASHGVDGSVLLAHGEVGVDEVETVRESPGRMLGPVSAGTELFVHEVDAAGSGPLVRLSLAGEDGPALATLEAGAPFFSHGDTLYFVSGGASCTAEAPRLLHRVPAGADAADLAVDVGCAAGPILADETHAYFPTERDGVYAGMLRRPLAGGDATPVDGSGPLTLFGLDESWLYGSVGGRIVRLAK